MSKKLSNRLEELELHLAVNPQQEQHRSAWVFVHDNETPEEGWRRKNGDTPYPTKPEYDDILVIQFLTPRWDEHGNPLHFA